MTEKEYKLIISEMVSAATKAIWAHSGAQRDALNALTNCDTGILTTSEEDKGATISKEASRAIRERVMNIANIEQYLVAQVEQLGRQPMPEHLKAK